MNKWEAIGRLKWTAKSGKTKYGTYFTFFTIETTEKFENKKGKLEIYHDSIPCVHFSKGRPPPLLENTKVKIEGKIQTRKNNKTEIWETQANITSIEVLEDDSVNIDVDPSGNIIQDNVFDVEIPF